MKKSLLLITVLAALLFSSCGHKTIFDDTHSFNGDIWKRFELESFQVDVKNADDCYDIFVTVTIDTAFFHENALPLTVKMSNDNRETRTLFGTILLRSREGAYLGEFDNAGHLIVRHKLRDYFFFSSAGHYDIQVGQRTNKYEIRGIKQFGLSIIKAELDLPND